MTETGRYDPNGNGNGKRFRLEHASIGVSTIVGLFVVAGGYIASEVRSKVGSIEVRQGEQDKALQDLRTSVTEMRTEMRLRFDRDHK